MKKQFLIFTILLACFCAKAAPVSEEEAQTLALNFVSNTFEQTRQSDNLTLVYSMPSFYVFNIGETGFVIMSADDSYNPVIGYSYEGVFDPDNMAPALQDYLNGINEERMQRGFVNADAETVRDWESLREYGRLVSRFGGKEGTFLCTTKWNQNYPYNYCCPADSDGPGGHVYAGCVATAAAQLMKYWNHPLQGRGSHTYTPQDNPQYGPITVDFGATTYEWDKMPNTIGSSSSMAYIEAIGTLIYHCGVAVDMNYRPSSSGATTTKLCTVMPQYFYYTNQMVNIKREDYTKEAYLNFLYKAIDKNWPMVHRGGGHAYVLDGYDDNGFVHFNWGWGGNSDGFFDIDGHNYTDGQSVIYNYVPEEIYNATPNVPTNISATAAENYELSTTVTWTNPAITLTNQTLSGIDRIVVKRNNIVVYTNDNVTPGETMTFEDNTIPCFDTYTYRVYAEVDGMIGESAYSNNVTVGPTCQWKFVVSSQNIQGWKNGYIALYDAAGTQFERVTVTNSSPTVVNVEMPIGPISMAWVPSEETSSFTITMNIKDSQGNSVYNYSGDILDMEEGVFYTANNGCGNEAPSEAPSNLYVINGGDRIILSWTGVSSKDGYGYNVYRDGLLVKLVYETEFVDENPTIGGHCYQVSYLGDGGQSAYSNEACGNAGEGCDTGSNLWYDVQNNFKPIITWEAPENAIGLSGYYVYRKTNADGEYARVKIVSANKTEYKETSNLQSGNFYYYKVLPYYQSIECFAAPIKSTYNNEYFVKYWYSVDAVDENYESNVSIYPNPTSGNLNIEAAELESIAIFNLVGQKIYEENISGDECVIDMNRFGSGIYMVKIKSADGSTTKKITVIE